jgi:hypothetical protein
VGRSRHPGRCCPHFRFEPPASRIARVEPVAGARRKGSLTLPREPRAALGPATPRVDPLATGIEYRRLPRQEPKSGSRGDRPETLTRCWRAYGSQPPRRPGGHASLAAQPAIGDPVRSQATRAADAPAPGAPVRVTVIGAGRPSTLFPIPAAPEPVRYHCPPSPHANPRLANHDQPSTSRLPPCGAER